MANRPPFKKMESKLKGVSGDADYPAWKHPRVDTADRINPLPATIESFFGGGVYGERHGHGYTDDGQDNAQVSPATVTLKNMSGSMLRQHELVCWSSDTNEIHPNDYPGVTTLPAATPYVNRFATIVSEPEELNEKYLMSVTLHPWSPSTTENGGRQVGITQTDAKVGDSVTVGIQHFSQLVIDKSLVVPPVELAIGMVVGIGCIPDNAGDGSSSEEDE